MDEYSVAKILYGNGYRAEDVISLMIDYSWSDFETNEIANALEIIEDNDNNEE